MEDGLSEKGAAGGSRRRRPLDDAERAQIALVRFQPLESGQAPTKIAELSKRFGRAEAVIIRAIQTALQSELVKIRVDLRTSVESPSIKRVGYLERDLRAAFPSLRQTWVIDDTAIDSLGSEVPRDRRSDLVHELLGRALARVVEETLLRDGDVLGLGSGRAVYYTVAAIQPWLSLEEVTLMSLTGALFPLAHRNRDGVGLDADFHVALLGTRFSKDVTCRNLAYPIAHENVASIRESTHLAENRFRAPNHAIVGVGVLEGGHRFARERLPPILKPIDSALARLRELVMAYESADPPYCPVADICNWLFPVPHPQGLNPPEWDEIEERIAEVNEKLLTITKSQLTSIQTITLVAGTRQKALAIHSLLEDPELKVRNLCTDAAAAQEILSLKRLAH